MGEVAVALTQPGKIAADETRQTANAGLGSYPLQFRPAGGIGYLVQFQYQREAGLVDGLPAFPRRLAPISGGQQPPRLRPFLAGVRHHQFGVFLHFLASDSGWICGSSGQTRAITSQMSKASGNPPNVPKR